MQTVKESYSPGQVNRSDRQPPRRVPSGRTRTGRTKGRQGNTPLFKSWHSQRFVLRSSPPSTFCHLCTPAQKKVCYNSIAATPSDSLEMSALRVPVVQKTDLRDQQR